MEPGKGIIEIETILAGNIEEAKVRQSMEWDRQYTKRPKVVLFGCGNLGRTLLKCMKEKKIVVAALCDNNEAKWGQEIEGYSILSPQEAAKAFGKYCIFVVSIHSPGHAYEETRTQLESLGCSAISSFLPFLWKYVDSIKIHFHENDAPSFFIENKKDILAAYKLLSDQESRARFVGYLKWRMTGEFKNLLPISDTQQYFPDSLYRINENEVFVDCGAYDGDTLRSFSAKTSSFFYIAYEPDPQSFEKLVATSEEIKSKARSIQCHRLATAESNKTIRFNASGGAGAAIADSR